MQAHDFIIIIISPPLRETAPQLSFGPFETASLRRLLSGNFLQRLPRPRDEHARYDVRVKGKPLEQHARSCYALR